MAAQLPSQWLVGAPPGPPVPPSSWEWFSQSSLVLPTKSQPSWSQWPWWSLSLVNTKSQPSWSQWPWWSPSPVKVYPQTSQVGGPSLPASIAACIASWGVPPSANTASKAAFASALPSWNSSSVISQSLHSTSIWWRTTATASNASSGVPPFCIVVINACWNGSGPCPCPCPWAIIIPNDITTAIIILINFITSSFIN